MFKTTEVFEECLDKEVSSQKSYHQPKTLRKWSGVLQKKRRV